MINNKSNENPFLFFSTLIFQIALLVFSIINVKYWKKNFYNIYLTLDIVYKAIVIFYLMMTKFWNIKKDECKPCYLILDIFFNSILLIILICKTISDSKYINNKKILLIINSLSISVCILILALLYINKCFCLKENKSGLIKKLKKEEKNVAIIKKFRGFKINKYNYSSLTSFGILSSEEICFLLESYFTYSIKKSQLGLINLINKLRKKKNIQELKYDADEKLCDFFIQIKRFYALDNINKINNNIYLFIYPKDEFKEIILKNDVEIMKILYKNYLDHIIILEKNNNEYILIFSSNQNNNIIINKNNESTKETDRNNLLKLNQNN